MLIRIRPCAFCGGQVEERDLVRYAGTDYHLNCLRKKMRKTPVLERIFSVLARHADGGKLEGERLQTALLETMLETNMNPGSVRYWLEHLQKLGALKLSFSGKDISSVLLLRESLLPPPKPKRWKIVVPKRK